jgi:hypothetical protein
MTVKITKPALNLREELADLRKPSGIAGEALLRADSVQEQRDLLQVGRKNLIINGGFDVWQRGTSTSLVGGPSYIGADRWKLYINTSSTVYMDRKDFTAGQTEVTGNPKHYLKFDWLGTGSSRVKIMEQLIEDVHTTQGKPVTLTFWARTQMADDPTISFTQKFGTGGSAATTAHSEVVDCTTSWQKFTITTTLPSISGKTVGIGSSLQISFAFSGTLNSYLEIAQVQLEVGSVATDFEHRSYGEILADCQRFYQIGAVSSYDHADNAIRYITGMFVVQMRTTPTMVKTNVLVSGAENGTTFSAQNGSYYWAEQLTSKVAVGGTWTADAEL